MPSRTNRVLPSQNSTFTPPGWRLRAASRPFDNVAQAHRRPQEEHAVGDGEGAGGRPAAGVCGVTSSGVGRPRHPPPGRVAGADERADRRRGGGVVAGSVVDGRGRDGVGRRRRGEIDPVAQVVLLQVRQEVRVRREDGRRRCPATGREATERRVVVVEGQPHLLEVVLAREPRSGGPHLLNGRQQQADQHPDDGDGDHKFDQGEPAAAELGYRGVARPRGGVAGSPARASRGRSGGGRIASSGGSDPDRAERGATRSAAGQVPPPEWGNPHATKGGAVPA
jgi:hypothetical protein